MLLAVSQKIQQSSNREKKTLIGYHIVTITSVKSRSYDDRTCVKFMCDLGVAHVHCFGLFILFDLLSSLGLSETAVLESSL